MGYYINDMQEYVTKVRDTLLQRFEQECIDKRSYFPTAPYTFQYFFEGTYLDLRKFDANVLQANWKDTKNHVEKYRKSASENSTDSDATLHHLLYCYAILKAIERLIRKEQKTNTPTTSSRRQFIEQQVDRLNGLSDVAPLQSVEVKLELSPIQQHNLEMKEEDVQNRKRLNNVLGNVAKPFKAVVEGVKDAVGIVEEELQSIANNVQKEAELIAILRSKEFVAIEKYAKDVLKNDTRSHTFFCCCDFTVQEKYSELEKFIKDIKEDTYTVGDLKMKLKKFYFGNEEGDTPLYDTLNTGQNITTYLFGAFGKRTTTIQKIDAFAEYVFSPKEPDERTGLIQ